MKSLTWLCLYQLLSWGKNLKNILIRSGYSLEIFENPQVLIKQLVEEKNILSKYGIMFNTYFSTFPELLVPIGYSRMGDVESINLLLDKTS